VESLGLVHADYLDRQLARQKKVLRAAISETLAEKLAPLVANMETLLDSYSKAVTLPGSSAMLHEVSQQEDDEVSVTDQQQDDALADRSITLQRINSMLQRIDSPASQQLARAE